MADRTQKEKNRRASRRLEENHGYGEKQLIKEIWWPAFGNLDNLHPEYEVHDYEGGYRYLDLAFIRSMITFERAFMDMLDIILRQKLQ